MGKLALDDEILLSIEKPERYIGGEVNMVKKDPATIDIRVAMCFPDVYEIGMSHLGIQILYDMFNKRSDTYCERVYSPWLDLDKIMREKNINLFTLETQSPVKLMDFLGITLQYEMCYTNILQVLELSQIPIYAKDRTEEDPIVMGGGPCSYNPEPIADFFDFFYMGEGEVRYNEIFDLYKKVRAEGGTREDYLERIAEIEGVYVPKFYDVEYNEDGTIKSFTPNNPHAKEKITKQLCIDMDTDYYPEKPLVPFCKATQDRVVLEIQRGCIRQCRFCQAGSVYKPVRERSLEYLKDKAYKMLKSTGHEEISLSSLSSSDYSELAGIVNFLIDEFKGKGVNISLPSLRIDSFALDVMSKVQDVRKSSLTFAPEAGSQRMRNVINKGLTEDVILHGASLAFHGGWNRVKLYFMLGLPGEEVEDMEGIADLSEKIAELYYEEIPKEERHGKVSIVASTSFFVPKPFTPFQWASMNNKEQFLSKARIVNTKMKSLLNHKSIRYNWHEADVSVLEGLLARGDRKISKVIYDAYKGGALYDSWSDSFDERDLDEILPWDFIDIGVTKQFLKKEWERAKQELVTPNCRTKCAGCGAARFGGGVCFEDKN